jgi:PAS fold
MSSDWTQRCRFDGKDFTSDTREPSKNWLQEYILPEDVAQVMAAINKAIRTKGVFQMEHRVQRADGSVGRTFSRGVPRLDKNGEIVKWFVPRAILRCSGTPDRICKKLTKISSGEFTNAPKNWKMLTAISESCRVNFSGYKTKSAGASPALFTTAPGRH